MDGVGLDDVSQDQKNKEAAPGVIVRGAAFAMLMGDSSGPVSGRPTINSSDDVAATPHILDGQKEQHTTSVHTDSTKSSKFHFENKHVHPNLRTPPDSARKRPASDKIYPSGKGKYSKLRVEIWTDGRSPIPTQPEPDPQPTPVMQPQIAVQTSRSRASTKATNNKIPSSRRAEGLKEESERLEKIRREHERIALARYISVYTECDGACFLDNPDLNICAPILYFPIIQSVLCFTPNRV